MRLLRVGLAAAALFVLGGCHRVAFQTRLPTGGRIQERQLAYWWWGTVGKHDVDLDELCPEGVAAFHVDDSAFGLWNFVTLGIYVPRTLVVECTGAGVRK